MPTLIIAEAGVNHDGDIGVAKQLIDAAAEAGADFVKFQTFVADRLATRSAEKAGYQARLTGSAETQHSMLKRLELGRNDHITLIDHCGRRGIRFLSTGFDTESVDLLVELGTPLLKIPSGEITNLPYLRHVGRQRLPVILSTGMSTIAEVGAALEVLTAAGAPLDTITLLHCNTEYPTPMVDVNLRAMATLRETFGVGVGYSDHTVGIEVPIAAVAMGAVVIEKHFTLDRARIGPDHAASLEPAELTDMVSAIRNIEAALGAGVKTPSPSESGNREVARRSIVAARDISAGETFSEENLATKRPGTGLSPMLWDRVVGAKAKRGFRSDELIEL